MKNSNQQCFGSFVCVVMSLGLNGQFDEISKIEADIKEKLEGDGE